MVFSEKVKENSHKLNRFYEVVSFDAVNLFTSINVPRVVELIIERIYENPVDFFPENTSQTVLLKYSAFWTLNGYYRQKCGLSMSSKLSPAISNIFLNMLESVIIKKYIEEKTLLFYVRYVDDCLLFVRKRYKNIILD